MPNAFQFIDKKTGQAEAFNVIDEKLCAFLGVPVSETQYYRGWYDSFGWDASLGKTFAQMKEKHKDKGDEEVLRMLDWFEQNYTTDSWFSPK